MTNITHSALFTYLTCLVGKHMIMRMIIMIITTNTVITS